MDREIKVSVTDRSNKQFNIKSLDDLIEFVEKERHFWQKAKEGVDNSKQPAHQAINFYQNFDRVVLQLKQLKNSSENLEDDPLQRQVNSIIDTIYRAGPSQWIWSEHPYCQHFVEINKKYNEKVAEHFFIFVAHQSVQNINNKDGFLGTLFGYEFLYQGSDILSRREGESKALQELKSTYSNKLKELAEEYSYELNKFQKNIIKNDTKFNELHNNISEKWEIFFSEKSKNIKAFQDHTRKSFEEEKAKRINETNDFIEKWNVEFKNLEHKYEEHLRLEKPAKYWKLASDKYQKDAKLWSRILTLSIVLGLTTFFSLFYIWLTGEKVLLGLNTVQGIIIFGSLLATYAYFVRAVSRITFSSFHLMRDAQEREQLTYVYLSLVNNRKIDEESRSIVLQSLFSRTETGLLSSESGPTMPGVNELLGLMSKSSHR